MKYQKIYKALEKGGAQISHEASGWKTPLTFYGSGYSLPLQIIAEAKKPGIRLWISHVGGQFFITTANMNLDYDSREYHESYRRYSFHTQTAASDCLEALLQISEESDGAA